MTERTIASCPVCGANFLPHGQPFINQKRLMTQGLPITDSNFSFEVLLDNLRSTLNVGSIFRTSDGAGVREIHCCGTCPTPEHPKIVKTSLGAQDFTKWSYHLNALDLVKQKKGSGYKIISLEACEKSTSLFDHAYLDKSVPSLLVVGNEVTGIDPEILENSDEILFIPMHGKKSSLNVSVAFGIAVYTLLH
ncbi:MAG: RNA methyltransferase [Anaerolineaceae bacterium]